MKTVIINLKEDEIISSKEVPVNCIININSSFVDMSNHLNQDELGALIQFKHNQPSTILNVTDVTPYALLFFDDELCFKGASCSVKSGTGSFNIQTQYNNILFVRMPHNLKLNQIINLNI
jgi:hypothetical protein